MITRFVYIVSGGTTDRVDTGSGIVAMPLRSDDGAGAGDSDAALNRIDGGVAADFSHMYFGTDNSTVVTSQTGSTAHLPCIVNNVGDGVVSTYLFTYCLELQETDYGHRK